MHVPYIKIDVFLVRSVQAEHCKVKWFGSFEATGPAMERKHILLVLLMFLITLQTADTCARRRRRGE